jgi:tRNA(adenine34) deaminase
MDDIFFMKEALLEAQDALCEGEIPVGAVIVKDGAVIGRGHNGRKSKASPLAHAEISALTGAAERLGNWRLDRCTIYVTLEPCAMCAGAIVQCRLGRVVYGARDPKAGACGSLYNIPADPRMYHRCEVKGGILKDECAALLRLFFERRRKGKL